MPAKQSKAKQAVVVSPEPAYTRESAMQWKRFFNSTVESFLSLSLISALLSSTFVVCRFFNFGSGPAELHL